MNLKPFYIKKFGARGSINIWIVNGSLIRSSLDPEFSNFGQHYHYPYIPVFEFWLDQEAVHDEYRFFIDNLLVEWRLMRNGMSYFDASTLGDGKEKAERALSRDYLEAMNKDGTISLSKIRREVIQKMENGVTVWLVNGRLVRHFLRLMFVEGGHDFVYNFVPHNEVWIDEDILASERPYIILHELHERRLMKNGMTYDPAHDRSSAIEWKARHDRKVLVDSLNELGFKFDDK